MNTSRTQRPRLFERLKKGLEELGQEARGEITLQGREVEKPYSGSQRVSYDSKGDTLHIRLQDTPVETSNEIEPGVLLDYDSNGNLVGIAVQAASMRIAKSEKTAA